MIEKILLLSYECFFPTKKQTGGLILIGSRSMWCIRSRLLQTDNKFLIKMSKLITYSDIHNYTEVVLVDGTTCKVFLLPLEGFVEGGR